MTLRSRKGTDGGTAKSNKIWKDGYEGCGTTGCKVWLLPAVSAHAAWRMARSIDPDAISLQEGDRLAYTDTEKADIAKVSYRANIALLFVSLDTV